MSKPPIRVLIADDDDIYREGLRFILQSANDIKVIEEVSTAQLILRKVIEFSPDIITIDLRWYGDSTAGWTAIRDIKANIPDVKIIAITAYENLIRDSRIAGADAALVKTYTKNRLLTLIRELYTQDDRLRRFEQFNTNLENLTKREIEVLELVGIGKSDKEISIDLHIAESTVKNHIKTIFTKLGVNSRTEAARLLALRK